MRPLQRARRTAELVRPSAPVATESRLREMSFGTWEGQTIAGLRETVGAAFLAAEAQGLDFQPPGGESPRQLQQRALDFVASLDVPEAVIVTHAGVIRTLLAHWQGLPPTRWTELGFAYASRTQVDVSR